MAERDVFNAWWRLTAARTALEASGSEPCEGGIVKSAECRTTFLSDCLCLDPLRRCDTPHPEKPFDEATNNMAEQEVSAKAIRKAVKQRAGWLLDHKECVPRPLAASFGS